MLGRSIRCSATFMNKVGAASGGNADLQPLLASVGFGYDNRLHPYTITNKRL